MNVMSYVLLYQRLTVSQILKFEFPNGSRLTDSSYEDVYCVNRNGPFGKISPTIKPMVLEYFIVRMFIICRSEIIAKW